MQKGEQVYLKPDRKRHANHLCYLLNIKHANTNWHDNYSRKC